MTDEDPPDEEGAAHQVRLERLEAVQGRLPGDRRVRVVRPREFRREGGNIVATEEALASRGNLERAFAVIRRALFGRRLATEEEGEERLSKTTGLAIFASDNISSSAYATEETMRVLALAGAGALALTMPLTVAIIVILVVVVSSYLQVIRAYPRGGGSYIVASENLGTLAGLVAAAALLIDYVLTVAVSVAAGVAAISSAFPDAHDDRVGLAILLITLLTLGNLRGVREAGLLFAGPTYLYVATVLGLVGFGFWRIASGATLPPALPIEAFPASGTEALTIFLVLKAFSSGSVGLSGTEAVANGVPAFRRPESRNAGIVLVVMGTLFGTLFFAVSYLATRLGVQPDASETRTVLSLLGRSLVGEGPYFYLLQASTAIILILAANTSFSGFPRLASILANDRFLPRQFAQRGERLAFSTGIVALAIVAAFLVFLYDGSVTGLIPLYTIGVFVAFSLSQAGMVRRWVRTRSRGWLASAAINALGAAVTTIVALVVAVTKFAPGAWLVIAVLPLIVAGLYATRRHYRDLEDRLLVPPDSGARLVVTRPRVIVPVSRLDRPALHALSIARGLGGDLAAVHISYDEDGAAAFRRRWAATVGTGIHLDIVISPYRALLTPLLKYIDAIDEGDPRRPVVVVLAEFVPRHWWEGLLHNQTALLLKLRLFVRPNTVVMDVPFQVDDAGPDAGA